MPEVQKVICITCPKGCTLDVTREGDTILKVENFGCKRGQDYVYAELTDPRRMVATTVRISGSVHPRLPVSTSAAFPRGRIKELLEALNHVEMAAPVKMGDVVLADALGTGINILASRDMVRAEA